MPSKKGQMNQEVTRAAQSCWKPTDIFKTLKPSKELKELSASGNQDIATCNLASEGQLLNYFFFDGKILADFYDTLLRLYLSGEK